MTAGIIVGLIIFGLFAINVKKYVEFMNMDFEIYKEFAVYSILQLYIQLVFSFVLEKLYFEGKEKKANKYCTQLNLLNFIILIVTAIFTKNKTIIVAITLISIAIYTLIVTIKQYKKFKFKLHIIKYIKYESVEIADNILFFLIFLFGLSNAMEFGEKYTVALNFVALITDTQWDSFEAISTVAKIDISNFIIYPVYRIKTCYLQLVKLAKKVTENKITAGILRFLISLLKTPYCTGIGQVTSSLYQFLTVNIMFNKNFAIDKTGKVLEK